MNQPKERAPIQWKTLGVIFGIIGLVSIIIVAVLFAVDAKEQAKEVKSYELKPWSLSGCPFPFALKTTLKRYKPKIVWAMMKEINGELKDLGYKMPIYVKAGEQPKGHVTITLRGSEPSERKNGKKCYAPFMGPNSAVSENVMGFLHYKVMQVGNRLIDSTVVMCDDKHKRMSAIVKKPSGLVVHKWKRYVKHELLHPLTGANHPNWHADVAHANAPFQHISKGMMKVLKRIYDPVCISPTRIYTVPVKKTAK